MIYIVKKKKKKKILSNCQKMFNQIKKKNYKTNKPQTGYTYLIDEYFVHLVYLYLF